jgi:dihydrofolate reductase
MKAPKKASQKTAKRKAVSRRVRYSVAVSLDGFIAGPKGEFDWIIMDPTLDFETYFKQFDTFLLGRRTFEVTRQSGAGGVSAGTQTIVFSRKLRQSDYPKVVISRKVTETISALKKEPGKDIWLFGGGELFRSVLDAGLVDTVEVAIMPILLSQGVPLLAAGARSPSLQLTETKTLPSGTVLLSYAVTTKRKRKGR